MFPAIRGHALGEDSRRPPQPGIGLVPTGAPCSLDPPSRTDGRADTPTGARGEYRTAQTWSAQNGSRNGRSPDQRHSGTEMWRAGAVARLGAVEYSTAPTAASNTSLSAAGVTAIVFCAHNAHSVDAGECGPSHLLCFHLRPFQPGPTDRPALSRRQGHGRRDAPTIDGTCPEFFTRRTKLMVWRPRSDSD